ncbi:Glutamate 5-kinase, partial [Dysosmobacter welbionis]
MPASCRDAPGPGTVPAQRRTGGGWPGAPGALRDAPCQWNAGNAGVGGCVSRHLPGGTDMNLAVYEWRKLFRLPALWAFLALCLAFNGLLIATLSPYDRAFFNETSQTAKALGQRVDEDFLAGLDAIPATENRDLLRQSVTGMEDIFETYDTGELSDFYAGVVEKSPLAVTWMTWKYDLLASRVEHLAQTDAALDLYAGLATYGSHQFLFGALFRAILCESAILAMLGTLYLLGYEGMHRAEGLACASRTGRKLRRVKVLAALQASAALYG